jgi:hypothetical protein
MVARLRAGSVGEVAVAAVGRIKALRSSGSGVTAVARNKGFAPLRQRCDSWLMAETAKTCSGLPNELISIDHWGTHA